MFVDMVFIDGKKIMLFVVLNFGIDDYVILIEGLLDYEVMYCWFMDFEVVLGKLELFVVLLINLIEDVWGECE